MARVKEFIVPEDGFVVKTTSGRPLLSLSVHAAGNVLTMFGADGEPKLVLGTEGDGGSLIIGDPANPEISSAFISAREDACELGVLNSAKRFMVRIDRARSELGFVSAENVITSKLYVDQIGWQLGLGDPEGKLMVRVGAGIGGGSITLFDEDGDERLVI
jgi:hypothetical protein